MEFARGQVEYGIAETSESSEVRSASRVEVEKGKSGIAMEGAETGKAREIYEATAQNLQDKEEEQQSNQSLGIQSKSMRQGDCEGDGPKRQVPRKPVMVGVKAWHS